MKNSGIYIVKNLVNNKIYVGSSCNLNKRKAVHFRDLNKNTHHSTYLQASYNKYSSKNFEFIIIFHCNKDDCIEFENYFIQTLNPEYNIAKDALAPMKGRKHSTETIERFKDRPAKRSCDHYLYGKSPSNETKAKQLEKRISSKRSKETKDKMRETAIRINAINRVDREKAKRKVIDNDGIIYRSLVDASERNNLSLATVCDILKGRHSQTRKKKSFKYYG